MAMSSLSMYANIRKCISVLPTELTDAIVDEFCFDKQTLNACSLVCRAFCARSRHHLFTEVSFCSEKPVRTEQFLDLVYSPWCTILPSIRRLSAHFRPRHDDLELWKNLISVLCILPRVDSLSLMRPLFSRLDGPILANLFAAFSKLKSEMRLVAATVRNVLQFTELVAACHNIHSLRVEQATICQDRACRLNPLLPPPRRLQHLYFSPSYTNFIINWLSPVVTKSLMKLAILDAKSHRAPVGITLCNDHTIIWHQLRRRTMVCDGMT